MPSTFILDITGVRLVLQGLRTLREKEPENVEAIDRVICFMKNQMTGKLKQLEPFMRNPQWIRTEINHELSPPTEDYHECANPTCKQNARGKFCAACWLEILCEFHSEKSHAKVECRKA
jgi:hypothetical protein